MYSVVLMTAMTVGGAGAQEHCFGRFHGCNGCNGCYGGCYSSGCHGGCYGGGWGGCHGCYGGGCYGGCYGGNYYGGGYGYGHSCFSAYQCHGGFGCSGWTGCYGCSGCYGPVVPAPAPGPGPGPKPEPKPGEKPATEEVRAKLTVELPEDAKLYVDNVPMKSTSAQRSFVTPILENGKTYYYTLKAEMVRDGQTVTVTGQVVIQPGQDLRATLSEPSAKGTFVVKSN